MNHIFQQRLRAFFLLFLLISVTPPASAQTVQVNHVEEMNTGAGERTKFTLTIGNGLAQMNVRVKNLSEEDVVVFIGMNYPLDSDFGLDELVDKIILSTETSCEEDTTETCRRVIWRTSIKSNNLMPLNPNQHKIFYSATLQYPPDSKTYNLRMKVSGNYE